MADAARPASRTVTLPREQVDALRARPRAFGFYQAMRLLDAAHRDRPRLGRSARPAQDAVRLGQEPVVEFASATLAGWEPAFGDRPERLQVEFFGLFGPEGPLPLHLTEYARDRRRNHRDRTLQSFADMFHHRALSLLWRAWADSRPTVSYDRPEEDRWATYVAALIGYAAASLRERDAMPDRAKLHFAGLLANQTRHAEGLGAILSAFFDVPVRVECFVGVCLALPPADHTRLGGGATVAALGATALLGGRAWTRQQKFRVVVGPLALADYLRLLPGGDSFHRLVPIVRNYVGDVMLWDVNLVLRRAEVPDTTLGQAGRLGWTTWLGRGRRDTDAADLFLDASADARAQVIDAGLER